MKLKKGFIKATLVIPLVVSILVIGIVGYLGASKYKRYQQENILKEQKTLYQQEVLEQAQAEIEKLKQESAISKIKQSQLEQTVKKVSTSTQNNEQITAKELAPYLTGIGSVQCFADDGTQRGSGSLWNFGGSLGYAVLTNEHVINPNGDRCSVSISSTAEDKTHKGFFRIDVSRRIAWNEYTDIASVPITYSLLFEEGPDATAQQLMLAVSKQNYTLTSLGLCPTEMPQGSPVVLIGYPSYSAKVDEIIPRTVTNGIISGFDETVKKPRGDLPYVNYLISAKIDSGNSGGLALSKNKGKLCILGIPTWLTVGKYETQGMLQNIHNVFYKP
jgi:S1-C subfamily serine protease